MTTQDPELSAALGWPGGIIDPVLDRTRLLQMVAALRLASQQALEALEFLSLDFFMLDPISPGRESTIKAITALRAALTQHVKPLTGLDKGNSHGGWIDDLRTTVKAAGGEKR